MSKSKKRIILATGGTGGHVFPALAIAEELLAQNFDVIIFSDSRGKAFNNTAARLIKIPSFQLKGTTIKKLWACFVIVLSIIWAFILLLRFRPHAIVGFGGYASFPTMVAAALLGRPTIIHQADAFFGRTNRVLSRWITRIATSFPHVENIPTPCQKKVSFTGLPVRADIKPASYITSEKVKPFHILVTGGSQGARVFSEIIPQAIALLDPTLQKRLRICQQCRPEFLEITKALYKQTSAQVTLSPFLERMGEHYKKAHLIISRAGASSVTEAAIVGRPTIFVPYPYAMDDHQYYNAKQAIEAKGGWMIREKDFVSKELAEYLTDLITNPWKLSQAAANIQNIVKPDAALRLAHLVKLIAV